MIIIKTMPRSHTERDRNNRKWKLDVPGEENGAKNSKMKLSFPFLLFLEKLGK